MIDWNESNFKWPLLLRETHFSGNEPASATPDAPCEETSTMLKKSRTIFETVVSIALALYLGYAFSELLLKSLIPDSWAAPGILISGLPFYFVLRWLRAETPQEPRLKRESSPFSGPAPMPKAQLVGKTVYRLTCSSARLCRTAPSRAPAATPSPRKDGPKPAHCYGKQTLQPGA